MPSVDDMVTEVHADIRPYTQGMAQLVTTTKSTASSITGIVGKIEDGFSDVRDAVTSVNGAIGFFSKGLLGLAGGAAVVKTVASTLEGLSKIAEGADAIGITTDRFQELTYAMSRAGVASNEQTEYLKHLAEQSYEASKGIGDLKGALEKHDASALKALKSSKDLDEQLGIVANAVRNVSSEHDKAAIITAAFGKNTDDLRRLMQGGAAGIEDAAEKARQFGVVIDEDLVRRAPEIQEKFKAAAAIISVEFQDALVGATPYVIALSGILADLAERIVPMVSATFRGLARDISDAFSSVESASTNGLIKRLQDTDAEIAKVTSRLNEMGADDPMRGTRAEMHVMTKLAELQRLRGEIEAELQRRPWEASIENTKPDWKEDADAKIAKNKEETDSVNNKNSVYREGLQLFNETLTPMEQLIFKQMQINALFQQGAIDAETYGRAMAQASVFSQKNMETLATSVSSNLEKIFGESKGVAISTALINTAVGISQAIRTYPPPLSIAMAGIQAAAGAAQVAAIRSQTSKGGGSVAGVSGGGGAAAAEAEAVRGVSITLQGDNFSRQGVRDLINALGEEIRDGAVLTVN
jgi:hypothetical protein